MKDLILKKIVCLGEAMLQPNILYLSYHHQGGWELQIDNKFWMVNGTPKSEIIDWLTELALSEEGKEFSIRPPAWTTNIPGVTVSGGMKCPSLRMKLSGGIAMLEQYEAMLQEVARNFTLYGSDKGDAHLRFAFCDYLPEEWHEQRRNAEKFKGKSVSYFGWDIPGAKKWKP